jgi:hypothetical protein
MKTVPAYFLNAAAQKAIKQAQAKLTKDLQQKRQLRAQQWTNIAKQSYKSVGA